MTTKTNSNTGMDKSLNRVTKVDVINVLADDQVAALGAALDDATHKYNALSNQLKLEKDNPLLEKIEAAVEKKYKREIAQLSKVARSVTGRDDFHLKIDIRSVGLTKANKYAHFHSPEHDERANRPRENFCMPGEFNPSAPIEVRLSIKNGVPGNGDCSSLYLVFDFKLDEKLKAERQALADKIVELDSLWVQRKRMRELVKNPAKIREAIKSRITVAALKGTEDGRRLIDSMEALGLVNGALTDKLVAQAAMPKSPLKEIAMEHAHTNISNLDDEESDAP